MKLSGYLYAALLTNLATAKALHKPPLSRTLDLLDRNESASSGTAFDSVKPANDAHKADKWSSSVVRGRKLVQAMKATDVVAATLFNLGETAESPFDGDGKQTFETWGYDESEKLQKDVDKECDFENYHKIKKTFAELGMDTKSKGNGGPNQCFVINHWDGPAVKRNWLGKLPEPKKQKYKVCETEYRVTEATHTMGVNPESGALFIMNIVSAAHGARNLWKQTPTANELPHLRSVSDVAWAFWNRASAGNLQNINYFFVNVVMNDETNMLIERAHRTLTPPRSGPPTWPGTEFGMDSEAGLAILGSPVGRWAGYFLMQHKRQLGGNKFVSKVRLFKPENFGPYPYLLFYVAGPGAESSADSTDGHTGGLGKVCVVERSDDGHQVVREHVLGLEDRIRKDSVMRSDL